MLVKPKKPKQSYSNLKKAVKYQLQCSFTIKIIKMMYLFLYSNNCSLGLPMVDVYLSLLGMTILNIPHGRCPHVRHPRKMFFCANMHLV